MKKLIILLLTFFSVSAFGQYTENEESFTKIYTHLRTWQRADSLWNYTDGTNGEWKFIYNVDFNINNSSSVMYGTILIGADGLPAFFFNYLTDAFKDEDELGIFMGNKVDILYLNEDTGIWQLWDTGEIRYYGSWNHIYFGEPSYLYFSYHKEKK